MNAFFAAFKLFFIIDKSSLLNSLSFKSMQFTFFTEEIQIRDLRFAYSMQFMMQMLQDLNLFILINKMITLIELSNCDKSIMIDLLKR